MRRSLGAVDDEKGIPGTSSSRATASATRRRRSCAASFDYGLPLPLAHSSLWLRSAAGVASGDRDNPVANFYFGGFGNNYVDNGTIKRYREYDSMPGFEIDEISGSEFRARRWSNGTCRRSCSNRSARRRST